MVKSLMVSSFPVIFGVFSLVPLKGSGQSGKWADSTGMTKARPMPEKALAEGEREKRTHSAPKKRALNVYPDSSQTRFQVNYSLKKRASVTLKVYDLKGQAVQTLYKGSREPGKYEVMFNATSPGIYLLQADINDTTTYKHLIRRD